ncbi:MAG TPA: class I SAM-dependent methyltransferase [Casimicrobiaceae bacterium]
MKECSKSIPRRLADSNFGHRYFVGNGIDIGGKPDPLALYAELFTRVVSVRTWDIEDGDAQFLTGIADESLDFVHSSHCLEHLADPREGLRNWFRVIRPGGHLIVTVPDEDLYEQGIFPSTFNLKHRHTFTIFKRASWSASSISVLPLLEELGPHSQVLKIELLDSSYRYGLPRYDQTQTPIGECGIEFVVRKRRPEEVLSGGRLPSTAQPGREARLHLNQYRDDVARMKESNRDNPPFLNDADI